MHFLTQEDKAQLRAINAQQIRYGLPTVKHSIWTGKLSLVPPPGASAEVIEKCRLANIAGNLDDLDNLLAQGDQNAADR